MRLWPTWRAVVVAGDTYAIHHATPEDAARAHWMPGPPAQTWLAEDPESGDAAGTYLLRPNLAGGGAHVANASFMVAPHARGRGVGRLLADHCLARARDSGYLAMQFNAVVATNTAAVALWNSLGFTTIGVVPDGFRHPDLGLVDLLVMHRPL